MRGGSRDPAPGGRRRPPGSLEAVVHSAVVRAGDLGATVPEVVARLEPPPAVATVATTLNRLVGRGVLGRSGRPARYVALARAESVVLTTAAAQRMHRLLAAAPDRAALLELFVDGLSADDEARLAGLLESPPDADPDADPDAHAVRRGGE